METNYRIFYRDGQNKWYIQSFAQIVIRTKDEKAAGLYDLTTTKSFIERYEGKLIRSNYSQHHYDFRLLNLQYECVHNVDNSGK